MEKEYIVKRLVKRWARRLVFFSAAWLCAIHLLWIPVASIRDVHHYKFWDNVLYATRSIEKENGYTAQDIDDDSQSVSGVEKYLPQSIEDISPTESARFVLTTGEQYAVLRDHYFPGMILAERLPHRTLFPFPFGVWVTYASQSGNGLKPSVVRVSSDWKARRLCAYIAKDEGGSFNLVWSFIPDVIIYALAVYAIVLYVRREKKKRREDSSVNEQFARLRTALVDFCERNGRFPKSLKEFGIDASTGEYDAVLRRGLLFPSRYGCGIALATANPWRAPFGIRRRTLAVLDDRTLVSIQGVLKLDSFYDKLRAACDGFEIGRFYTNKKNKMRFQHDADYANSFCPTGSVLKMLIIGYAPILCACFFYYLIIPFLNNIFDNFELIASFFKSLNSHIKFSDIYFCAAYFLVHFFTLFSIYALIVYVLFSKKSIFMKIFFIFLSIFLFLIVIFSDIMFSFIFMLFDYSGVRGLFVTLFLCGPCFAGWIALPEAFYQFVASLYGLI